VPTHVSQLGTFTERGLMEWDENDEVTRLRTFLQGDPKKEIESRKRLRKTSSYSSLYSQEMPISTQSSSVTARKIRPGRTRICRHGARGQEYPAIPVHGSCGCRADRASASSEFYSGPNARERAQMGYAEDGCKGKTYLGD
jgi:hypothetical protein